MSQTSKFLNRREASRYLRERYGLSVCERTLSEWDRLGRGPAHHRIGSRIFYTPRDLDALVEQSRTEGPRA